MAEKAGIDRVAELKLAAVFSAFGIVAPVTSPKALRGGARRLH
ncbi:hypothetical protein [Zoogloea sp.]|nr:hypothetical protein [Zoogloea sp.]